MKSVSDVTDGIFAQDFHNYLIDGSEKQEAMVKSVMVWRVFDLERMNAEGAIKSAVNALSEVALCSDPMTMPEADVRKYLTGLDVVTASGTHKVYGSVDVDSFLKGREKAIEAEELEAEADVVVTADGRKASETWSEFDRHDRNVTAMVIIPYTSKASFERVKLYNEKDGKEVEMTIFEGYIREAFSGKNKSSLNKITRSMINGILGKEGKIFHALTGSAGSIPTEEITNFMSLYGGKAKLLADGSFRFTYSGIKKASVVRGLALIMGVLYDEGWFRVKEVKTVEAKEAEVA